MRWVIIATDRAHRPQPPDHPCVQPTTGACPFCNGAEEDTPHETLSFRAAGTPPNSAGWWVRVVPNKFPALKPNPGPFAELEDDLHHGMQGYGYHEVIVESPHHRQTVDSLPINQVEEVFWALKQRIDHFRHVEGVRYTLIFKNHGRDAGASLEHPHCQLMAMPVVPETMGEELAGCQQYYVRHGGCIFCRLAERELEQGTRIIHYNDDFAVFCPYASRFPYECWIVPRCHQTDFGEIEPPQMRPLAEALQTVIQRLHTSLGDPALNWMLHTAPYGLYPGRYHWHIEVIPRITRTAGFEWGTGCYINPVPPERCAEHLRATPFSIVPVTALPHVSPAEAAPPLRRTDEHERPMERFLMRT